MFHASMKIIDSYILRTVLMGTLVAMLVLLPVGSFLNLADELDYVGRGSYTLADAFLFIGLSLPRDTYRLLPMAALIGSLWGLGNLSTHSELTAMRAAGISTLQIVSAVLKAGLVVALVAVLVGEVIAPASEDKGNQLRAELLSEGIVTKSRFGFWARDGRSFINIRNILPGGRLRQIYIYEFDDAKRLKLSTFAESAIYIDDTWRLEGIWQSEISEEGVQTRASRQAAWESLLDPGMLSLLVVEPNLLPVWALYRYIHFMEENGLSTTTYEVAFWGKMAFPLVILVMISLSVPLLFGNLHKVGVGQRVFVGVLIGIVFYVMNRAFSQLAVVYPLSPVLAAFLPGVLCFLGAFWLFRRTR